MEYLGNIVSLLAGVIDDEDESSLLGACNRFKFPGLLQQLPYLYHPGDLAHYTPEDHTVGHWLISLFA